MTMTPTDTIRFLHHEAAACRDRDAHEALCLLLPALLRLHGLQPMSDAEAKAHAWQIHQGLKNELERAA